MGIVNVTPDSFSDGGALTSVESAVDHARSLLDAGAHILDVGGESTRPGAAPVSASEECDRVLPVVEALSPLGAVISVDTSKPLVARAALGLGAQIINDIRGLRDPAMRAVAAESGAGVVLMHMRGEPATMQQGHIHYNDVVGEVRAFLAERLRAALAAGIRRERIAVDPGIGFGKTTEHNLVLTRHLDELLSLRVPVVYAPSRKRFLGSITGREVGDRDRATAAICALAVAAGAHIVRVHNVAATVDAVRVGHALRNIR